MKACKHKATQLYKTTKGEVVLICDEKRCGKRLPMMAGIKIRDASGFPTLPDNYDLTF